jgi:hypothetical protein
MLNPNHLSAGKTVYKLYHGYNFNPLIEGLKYMNLILVTFFQTSGSLRLWFVNELNPSQRIFISETNKKYIEVSIFTQNTPGEITFPYHRDSLFISDYYQKENNLYIIDLQKIYNAINELTASFERKMNENLE